MFVSLGSVCFGVAGVVVAGGFLFGCIYLLEGLYTKGVCVFYTIYMWGLFPFTWSDMEVHSE